MTPLLGFAYTLKRPIETSVLYLHIILAKVNTFNWQTHVIVTCLFGVFPMLKASEIGSQFILKGQFMTGKSFQIR